MNVVIYGKPNCPQCTSAKTLCSLKGLHYEYKELDVDYTKEELEDMLISPLRSFPQVFVDGEHVGDAKAFAKFVLKNT